MEEGNRKCLNCGKPLRGRLDKKFCDDYCRNNFNNRQNSDQNNFVRNVNRILRKNRRILEKHLQKGEKTKKIPGKKLVQEDFNFVYHTHQYRTQEGKTYFYSYEYGYLKLEDNWFLIVRWKAPKKRKNPEEA